MNCYENRLKSFTNWTGNENVEDLATIGFYNTNYKDIIVCYYCNYTDYNYYTGNEDTIFNHKRYSPNCLFYKYISNDTKYLNSTFNFPQMHNSNFSPDHRINLVNHWDYSLAEHRINSYANFPQILKHLIPELSDCGFYYTNCGDVVVCYVCNVYLKNLQTNTNVWQSHKKLNNNCPLLYVRALKNTPYKIDTSTVNDVDNTCDITVEPSAPEYNNHHYTLPKCLNCNIKSIDVVMLPCYHLCMCQECALTCVQCKACNVFVGGFFIIKIPTEKLNVVEYGQWVLPTTDTTTTTTTDTTTANTTTATSQVFKT
ncbi:iap-5 [Psilogramma increta granulovirus]|uniref:Iap-5 n=1 Tax=Psilogramma increta granulovirus TaxID=2953508 RepID=A0A977TP71_9BBAC|nr:iap-5 [Psilogramma increta granulovirus]